MCYKVIPTTKKKSNEGSLFCHCTLTWIQGERKDPEGKEDYSLLSILLL